MHMDIHQTRENQPSTSVYDLGVSRRFDLGADGLDMFIGDQDVDRCRRCLFYDPTLADE
jgi:hypothetical protein